MRKVLVVKSSVKDYSPAKKFGELQFVTFVSKDVRNVGRHLADSIEIMRSLDETPYIIVSGHLGFLLPLVLASYEVFKEIVLLIYDLKMKVYYERSISKESIDNFAKL